MSFWNTERGGDASPVPGFGSCMRVEDGNTELWGETTGYGIVNKVTRVFGVAGQYLKWEMIVVRSVPVNEVFQKSMMGGSKVG